jgi:hypothetical protein
LRAQHDSLPGDSGIECGAVYLHRFKMPGQNESSTDFSCATSTNTIYWYSLPIGPVWLHTWSTEHSYAPGSPQRAWIERDLAAAKAAKAAGRVSWIIVEMHYPSYCSHSYNGGGGCITDAPRMRAELEALWLAAGVDAVLFGHIHAAEVVRGAAVSARSRTPLPAPPTLTPPLLLAHTGLGSLPYSSPRPAHPRAPSLSRPHCSPTRRPTPQTWPVYNATVQQTSFVNPKAPVHFLIGMAGAGYLGPWQPAVPAWSAWRNQVYGWTRWHVEGSKSLSFFFYSYLNSTAPNWEMTITRE